MFTKLTKQLQRHEGSKRDADGRHMAYRCTAGALTIGYGHNLDAQPVPGISEETRLNEEQAYRLLQSDLQLTAEQVERCLPWSAGLDFPRFCVLVNMAFNLGIGGLLAFKDTLSAAREGNFDRAAACMLRSKWAGQVGNRARELAEQMRTGEWKE